MWLNEKHVLHALLVHFSIAQDVYMSVGADGTITFTDSPNQEQDFVVFDVDGPRQKRKVVTNKNFPRMDDYDHLILEASRKYMLSRLCQSGMHG